MTYDPKEVVIWGADVSEEALRHILDNKAPIKYVKLRRAAMSRMGEKMIEWIQERGYKVFADAKIIGTPDEIVELARDIYLPWRPWMLNVMAGGCSTNAMYHPDPEKIDALKQFADACIGMGTRPCAVTVLTSKTEEMVDLEFNERTPGEQVLVYAEILLRAGFTDVVCSPHEVELIRSESCFDDLTLNTPGIRLPGSSYDDQSRVDTPIGALTRRADKVIMRKELCKNVVCSGDFLERFARIVAHLNGEEVLA